MGGLERGKGRGGQHVEQRAKLNKLGLLATEALSAAGEVVGRAGRTGPVTRPLPIHHALGPAHTERNLTRDKWCLLAEGTQGLLASPLATQGSNTERMPVH